MAKLARTGFFSARDNRAVTIVIPAEGPSWVGFARKDEEKSGADVHPRPNLGSGAFGHMQTDVIVTKIGVCSINRGEEMARKCVGNTRTFLHDITELSWPPEAEWDMR
jgi:hypothetical protein